MMTTTNRRRAGQRRGLIENELCEALSTRSIFRALGHKLRQFYVVPLALAVYCGVGQLLGLPRLRCLGRLRNFHGIESHVVCKLSERLLFGGETR